MITNILPSINNVVDKLNELKLEIESQVRSFNRGIGILLKNKIIIFTKPFGVDVNHNNILVNSIKYNGYRETLENLDSLDSMHSEFFMNQIK